MASETNCDFFLTLILDIMSDAAGEIQKKEYYMREFWKKVGDNDSNKRKIAMTFPSGTYAVR